MQMTTDPAVIQTDGKTQHPYPWFNDENLSRGTSASSRINLTSSDRFFGSEKCFPRNQVEHL
jgi:hypothetical protein